MPYKVELPPERSESRLTGDSLMSKIPVRPVRNGKEGPEDDPILPVEAWFPVFKELHRRVIADTHNFDYGWLRISKLDLYERIKTKEKELDSLGYARLSEVMAIVREWRELVLKAEFESKETNANVNEG